MSGLRSHRWDPASIAAGSDVAASHHYNERGDRATTMRPQTVGSRPFESTLTQHSSIRRRRRKRSRSGRRAGRGCLGHGSSARSFAGRRAGPGSAHPEGEAGLEDPEHRDGDGCGGGLVALADQVQDPVPAQGLGVVLDPSLAAGGCGQIPDEAEAARVRLRRVRGDCPATGRPAAQWTLELGVGAEPWAQVGVRCA